ncbi:ATP-binding protein [Roseateles oligotrophus]|uniref:AAA family ATPase n=1 Tax=Roseateles oligotrophus TaxID=1769250 RepID=A0ABT2YE96_9BURK|nr:YhaN family protein [Roseateles oligotrophus]MCV2368341.1 AAA family ATPase [Roseateles oligotrophus]
MRIQQLDLKRYGKFTDQRMDFPAAERDFHLIVGANEAGKSTTRSAILDLMFGIETRSNYDFLHAKADMRLGACIEHGGAQLQFERSKARTKSLFDLRGQVLPEAALAAFLGASDRSFFDQMFGLDHGRLEAGGNAILSASNDLGQILFQSAAGIGSLAAVREQLDAEADKLWAKRRSGERAYYVASDELAAADAALKLSTVRTKEWLDARAKVEDKVQARAQLRARLDELELQRSALERVRRVAPVLRHKDAARIALNTLQQIALLPTDAARILSEVEVELASAARTQELFNAQAQAAAERLALVRVDEPLLRQQAEILALEQRRQQVRNHGREISRCRAELAGHWQQIEAELHRLGWPQLDEPALALRMPSLPTRTAFAGLAKSFGLLDQARRHAAAVEAEKKAEIQDLEAQLQGQATPKLPASLSVALSQARALGDVRAIARREEAAVTKAERDLLNARAGLGGWDKDVAVLRALSLPSEAALQQRLQRQLDLQSKTRALNERQGELRAGVAALELEIAQYAQAHRPVGAAELAQARAGRDAQWRFIKQGEAELQAAAAGFEASIVQADGLADQRHAKAREASELQAKQEALERLRQQNAELAITLNAQADEARAHGVEWQVLSESLGLGGMAALDLTAWRQARQRVLDAQDLLGTAQQDLQAGAKLTTECRANLMQSLAATKVEFDAGDSLETLMALAAETLASAAAATVRAEALARQVEGGRRIAQQLLDKKQAAQAEFEQWQGDWALALQEIGQPAGLSAAAAEGVCAALADIDLALKQMRELRLGRIEPMQRELADFDSELAACAETLGLALSGPTDSTVQGLMANLGAAQAAQQEALRLRQELAGFEDKAAAAGLRLSEAAGRLQPLLQRAGMNDVCDAKAIEGLRDRIAASEQRRLAEAALQAAEAALAEGGDGLDVLVLESEVAATDAAQIPLAVADLARKIAELQQQSEGFSAELNQAQTALNLIAGQDDAARAEGQRQDALAKMANAAERYVKVYTASRLLKWAIDRYRETKQGPMLGRAGEIFAGLTLGSFQRLSVDFEAQPLTLHGLRADGRLVEVAGMSEGTRDQLFMALRLAALELHIAQDPVHALPFVADDLFINYDDGRAEAGLRALAELSERTQVIFLSHHAHLLPAVRAVFGDAVNVIRL